MLHKSNGVSQTVRYINTYTYNLIGDAYQFGHAVDTDHEKAIKWCMRGAEYNDGYSQLDISKKYLNSPRYFKGGNSMHGSLNMSRSADPMLSIVQQEKLTSFLMFD